MQPVHDLFFELSHEDRMKILGRLQQEGCKLKDLANEISGTNQEAYRHVSRLMEADLASKNLDGDYVITPYGEQAMVLVSGYMFLTANRGYFKEHTLSLIPKSTGSGWENCWALEAWST